MGILDDMRQFFVGADRAIDTPVQITSETREIRIPKPPGTYLKKLELPDLPDEIRNRMHMREENDQIVLTFDPPIPSKEEKTDAVQADPT